MEDTRKTLVVNLFGGPGAGKTTCAWEIASKLKKEGFVAEYVPEYAKELTWEDNRDVLNGKIWNQMSIFQEQKHRLDRLVGKVDFIVTDSPAILGAQYLKEPNAGIREAFEKMALTDFLSHDNFNLFVERGYGYEIEGRVHTKNQAIKLDTKILRFLKKNDIFFGRYSHEQIDQSIENMKKTLDKMKGKNHKTLNREKQKFTSEKDFEVTWAEKGEVEYIGEGGDVVVPPVVDGCEVRGLHCEAARLTSLDLTHTPKLQDLLCSDNPLTTLDLTNNPNLTCLDCHDNNLTTLDLSQNTFLECLSCGWNNLTALDTSSAPILKWLYCSDNHLETLDTSHNPILEWLECDNNQLPTLDLSKTTTLAVLDCGDNFLTTLDLSHTPNLTDLDCRHNHLTTLDLSHNPALINLICTNNPLTTLDVSYSPKLLHHGATCVDPNVQVQTTPQHVAEKPSFAGAKAAAVGARDAGAKEPSVGKKHEQER